ncbi:hypothetical protein [Streptomyces torulosus]|uniref:hypothetical protein n=1 Tax=Streptomyces torulosus TaxID=68276 RepID=UPI000AB3CE6C|nr:hypothetical protein [Streptomyces torulosus]
MDMHKPYPSDLTDEQWGLVEPVNTVGLVIDCVVLPASAHDNAAGIALLDGVAG